MASVHSTGTHEAKSEDETVAKRQVLSAVLNYSFHVPYHWFERESLAGFEQNASQRKRRKFSSIMSKRVTRENSRKDRPRSDLVRPWTGWWCRASRVHADYRASAAVTLSLSTVNVSIAFNCRLGFSSIKFQPREFGNLENLRNGNSESSKGFENLQVSNVPERIWELGNFDTSSKMKKKNCVTKERVNSFFPFNLFN